MAVTDPYATPAEYRSALGKDDTGEDADVLSDLTAISRMIDREMDRFFNKDAAAVKRIYVGDGSAILYVDDLVSVTTIKIDTDRDGLFTDETALATTDYELLPRNVDVGSEPSPYRSVGLTDYGTQAIWPVGTRVEIDGVWGWPSVPESIKRACIHLTGILRIETPRAQASVSELGQLVQMSPKAAGIVADLYRNYRKPGF